MTYVNHQKKSYITASKICNTKTKFIFHFFILINSYLLLLEEYRIRKSVSRKSPYLFLWNIQYKFQNFSHFFPHYTYICFSSMFPSYIIIYIWELDLYNVCLWRIMFYWKYYLFIKFLCEINLNNSAYIATIALNIS